MPSHTEQNARQHTDTENSKPLVKATNAGDDLSQLSSRSVRDIALDNELGQQHLSGEGGENPGANVQAGK